MDRSIKIGRVVVVSSVSLDEHEAKRKDKYGELCKIFFGNNDLRGDLLKVVHRPTVYWRKEQSRPEDLFDYFDEFIDIANEVKTGPFVTRNTKLTELIREKKKDVFTVNEQSSFFLHYYYESNQNTTGTVMCLAILDFFLEEDVVLDYDSVIEEFPQYAGSNNLTVEQL